MFDVVATISWTQGKHQDTQQMAEEKDQPEEPKSLGTTLIG